MQSKGLHFPDELVTYNQIMKWKEDQEKLSETQLKKAGDYLTLKKEVENCWLEEDKKKFIKVKNLLKTHSHVITDIEKLKVVA